MHLNVMISDIALAFAILIDVFGTRDGVMQWHFAKSTHFVSVAVGFATRLPSLTRFFLKSSAPAPPLVFENAFVFGIAAKQRNTPQRLVIFCLSDRLQNCRQCNDARWSEHVFSTRKRPYYVVCCPPPPLLPHPPDLLAAKSAHARAARMAPHAKKSQLHKFRYQKSL
jgi:hypothetical protein